MKDIKAVWIFSKKPKKRQCKKEVNQLVFFHDCFINAKCKYSGKSSKAGNGPGRIDEVIAPVYKIEEIIYDDYWNNQRCEIFSDKYGIYKMYDGQHRANQYSVYSGKQEKPFVGRDKFIVIPNQNPGCNNNQ